MLKSLFLMSSVISMVGAVPNMDHLSSTTNNASEISVSYQYETNEVNSIDDLIVGNIYHFESHQANFTIWDFVTTGEGLMFYYFTLENEPSSEYFDSTDVYDEEINYNTYFSVDELYELWIYNLLYNDEFDNQYTYSLWYLEGAKFNGDVVLTSRFLQEFEELINLNPNTSFSEFAFFSASDYLGEPIIEEKEITGLYDIINNWFYDYLYDTEQLNNYSVAFMGSTITLSAYLSMVSTIACLILLTIILILFIKWLFNLFSGLLRF